MNESLPGILEKIPLLLVRNRNLELCFSIKCQRGAELVYNSLCLVMRLVAQYCPTLRPHGLYPARILCPWNSPGKNIGVGCHALLQGIFPRTQGSNTHLLHYRQILSH